MNPWFLFIIIVITGEWLLESAIDLLNIRYLQAEIPESFKDVYDAEEYARSQRYLKDSTRVSLAGNTVTTVAILVFFVLGGFNGIDLLLRSFLSNEIGLGLLFTALLLFLSWLLALPFKLYTTFIIEQKYGFNRTTCKTFITDLLKGGLLALVIGAPVLAMILLFFMETGSLSWLFCWLAVFLVMLILQYLGPTLIMPIFNTFDPLADGPLKEAINTYAAKERFRIQGIFVMDGSRRSTKANAFFTGFGALKKIVFYDTLLETLTPEQILAVLAHEMGHYKRHHLFKGLIMSFLQTGLIFFFFSLTLENSLLFAAFSMENLSIYASLVFFGFLYTPVNLVLSVLFNFISRQHEFEADGYAHLSTGGTEHLISALKQISKSNLSNLKPHCLEVIFHYSHPPVLHRITALQRLN